MSKSNADFRNIVSSGKYSFTPTESQHSASNANKATNSDVSDQKRKDKKRKRAERKKKYFDRKKATKEKERAQKEEEEFTKKLKAKLSKSEHNKNINFSDLPEQYKKLISGDLEHTHTFKGLDYQLLRQTKDKISKQQIEDIEIAYNDTIHNNNESIKTNEDNDGDISMVMDLKSAFAYDIHKSVMKYYLKNNKNECEKVINKINPKFKNGMIYRFNMDSNVSIPTEIMRSQIGYGLVLDDFNEFENDNICKQLCIGYTPKNVIQKIKNSLNNPTKNKQTKQIKSVEIKKKCEKRTFSEMNTPNIEKINDEINDFDIFEDVGTDYVCDINQNKKRRKVVSFHSKRMDEISKIKSKQSNSYFEHSNTGFLKNSNVKQAAASILKSSMNKAKIENAKVKRQMSDICMPSLERGKKGKANENSLKGKYLLNSGFGAYDDDDDEGMNSYNSDEDDQSKKTITAESADVEWKKMRETFGESGEKTSDSVKEKLNKQIQSTPSVAKFFG